MSAPPFLRIAFSSPPPLQPLCVHVEGDRRGRGRKGERGEGEKRWERGREEMGDEGVKEHKNRETKEKKRKEQEDVDQKGDKKNPKRNKRPGENATQTRNLYIMNGKSPLSRNTAISLSKFINRKTQEFELSLAKTQPISAHRK